MSESGGAPARAQFIAIFIFIRRKAAG